MSIEESVLSMRMSANTTNRKQNQEKDKKKPEKDEELVKEM